MQFICLNKNCFFFFSEIKEKNGNPLSYICPMPILPVEDFISKTNDSQYLLIDTRSESEFEHAHFPGAVNIPLLNNEHRILVGTCYKKEGRDAAVRLGFELVGPLFSSFVKKVDELAKSKQVLTIAGEGNAFGNYVVGVEYGRVSYRYNERRL
ncbi:MAG: hypothetical protein IPN88_15205 [Bacteroidetes bacterium]|nr:hypothetical protein [Bacteroidota bacterium]